MPTVSDLLAAAEPIVEPPKEGPFESLRAVSSASEMIGLPVDMERKDSQLVPPQETVESVAPLVAATTDKPFWRS